jgi:hypothetical protein
LFERTTTAELQKAVKTVVIFFVSVVTHDIGVSDFGEVLHDEDLSFIVRVLIELFFFDKFNSYDSVFAQMVPLIDHSEITLA